TKIIDIVTSIASVGLALVPSIIFSFWFKLNPKAVFLSICFGILGAVGAFIFMGIGIESALVSLPVSLIVLGICQWKYKK
ncbi:MAG: hypothetical protein KKH88_00975, partial [Nanoarchaeota archaeon]|nr:hypothetical protein [Nanoarchaeota archaeon]